MADYVGLHCSTSLGWLQVALTKFASANEKPDSPCYKGKAAYSRHKSCCIHIRHFDLSQDNMNGC